MSTLFSNFFKKFQKIFQKSFKSRQAGKKQQDDAVKGGVSGCRKSKFIKQFEMILSCIDCPKPASQRALLRSYWPISPKAPKLRGCSVFP